MSCEKEADRLLIGQYLAMLLKEVQTNRSELNHWPALYGSLPEDEQLCILAQKALAEPFHTKNQHFYCTLCYHAGYDDQPRYRQDRCRAVMEAHLSSEEPSLHTTLRPNGDFQSPKLYLGARLARFMQLAGTSPATEVSDQERLKVLKHTVRRIGHHSVPVSCAWDYVWVCDFFRRGQQIFPCPSYANEARADIGRIFRDVRLDPLPDFDPRSFESRRTVTEKLSKLYLEKQELEERLQEIHQKRTRLEKRAEEARAKRRRTTE